MKEVKFSHRFSIVIKVVMGFLCLILSMCCITSISLHMLSRLFISRRGKYHLICCLIFYKCGITFYFHDKFSVYVHQGNWSKKFFFHCMSSSSFSEVCIIKRYSAMEYFKFQSFIKPRYPCSIHMCHDNSHLLN